MPQISLEKFRPVSADATNKSEGLALLSFAADLEKEAKVDQVSETSVILKIFTNAGMEKKQYSGTVEEMRMIVKVAQSWLAIEKEMGSELVKRVNECLSEITKGYSRLSVSPKVASNKTRLALLMAYNINGEEAVKLAMKMQVLPLVESLETLRDVDFGLVAVAG